MFTDITRIVSFLSWLYGEEALLKGPHRTIYPVTVRPFMSSDIEDILWELIPDDRRFPRTSDVLERMKRENRHLWNGRTYILREVIDKKSFPGLRCSPGCYFDTINTCAVLVEELNCLVSTPGSNNSDFPRVYKNMPGRQRIHPGLMKQDALGDVWSGKGRSAAIGISCLFVINDGASYRYCMHRRSTGVADDAGLYHIVPSMIFQPISRDEQDDFNITRCILRELGEELFSHDEIYGPGDKAPVKEYSEMVSLRQLLQTAEAELVITGLAVDLLNLRPEILSVLIVHQEEWFYRHHQAFRFSPLEYAVDKETPGYVELDDAAIFESNGEFAPHRCTAVGAACLVVGLPAARKLRDGYRKKNTNPIKEEQSDE